MLRFARCVVGDIEVAVGVGGYRGGVVQDLAGGGLGYLLEEVARGVVLGDRTVLCGSPTFGHQDVAADGVDSDGALFAIDVRAGEGVEEEAAGSILVHLGTRAVHYEHVAIGTDGDPIGLFSGISSRRYKACTRGTSDLVGRDVGLFA